MVYAAIAVIVVVIAVGPAVIPNGKNIRALLGSM